MRLESVALGDEAAVISEPAKHRKESRAASIRRFHLLRGPTPVVT